MNDVGRGFERIVAALRKLGIPYAVGGSLAGSLHGIPRATVDIGFVVDVPLSQVDGLISELQSGFYADGGMIRAAIQSKRSFNLIDLETSYKFDLFPLPTARTIGRNWIAVRRPSIPSATQSSSSPLFRPKIRF